MAADSSTTSTVGWVTDPTGRGTFSLISSCLLTLGLCVWTAMHLNVPLQNHTRMQGLIRNIKWGLLGVVAPELVVFAAWRQYNSAMALCAEVKRHVDIDESMSSRKDKTGSISMIKSQSSGSESVKSAYPWTMTHGFYAGMGGFIFDEDFSSPEGGQPFIPGSQRLTLSARGIALLARCGHLPKIQKQDITDKSKADSLTKAIACLQATWMLVQVLGRVALGLPVTLLEVNVLGHVICALVIYVLWWHKPRLVHEPTKLEGDWVRPVAAYMYMSSQVSGWTSANAGLLRHTWIDPELSALAFFTPPPQSVALTEKFPVEATKQEHPPAQDVQGLSFQSFDGITTSVPESESMANLGYFGLRPRGSSPTTSFASSGTAEKALDPSSTQLTRWGLAADAVRRYGEIKLRFAEIYNPATTKDGLGWFEPTVEELVVRSADNWPSRDLLRGTRGPVMGMVLWFASMAYGAVHVAAWNGYFPTETEAWLWRFSAVDITCSGFLWLVINLLASKSRHIDAYWDNFVALKEHWTSYLIIGSLSLICGVAFVFARVFLVVEAFISIRQLPLAAYTTPGWTQVIPHL